jgi:hypothetical protein
VLATKFSLEPLSSAKEFRLRPVALPDDDRDLGEDIFGPARPSTAGER